MPFQDFSDYQSDALKQSKKQNLMDMRSTLLANQNGAASVNNVLQNVTILRIYHQLSRIIQYTELMDKLEDKLYEALDSKIDTLQPDDDETWVTLLTIQDKLQKNMIESTKLIQPYLDLTQYTFAQDITEESEGPVLSMDASKREQLRTSAKNVLKELNVG